MKICSHSHPSHSLLYSEGKKGYAEVIVRGRSNCSGLLNKVRALDTYVKNDCLGIGFGGKTPLGRCICEMPRQTQTAYYGVYIRRD